MHAYTPHYFGPVWRSWVTSATRKSSHIRGVIFMSADALTTSADTTVTWWNSHVMITVCDVGLDRGNSCFICCWRHCISGQQISVWSWRQQSCSGVCILIINFLFKLAIQIHKVLGKERYTKNKFRPCYNTATYEVVSSRTRFWERKKRKFDTKKFETSTFSSEPQTGPY